MTTTTMNEPSMAPRPLHSSVPSHLTTELQVLSAIIERSKFQHRSQPFLRRMREVLRLGSRVGDILANEDTEAVAVDVKHKVEIIVRFIQCLLKATVAIQQIIELEHFLPTQISVVAVYGRLFAIGISVATHFGLDLEEVLSGDIKSKTKSKGEKRKRKDGADTPLIYEDSNLDLDLGMDLGSKMVSRRKDTFDMGQKIERPVTVPVLQPESPVPIQSKSSIDPPQRSPADSPGSISSGSPPPSSPDVPPSPIRVPTPELKTDPIDPKPKLKKKKTLAAAQNTSTKKTKGKKKKDDMDDIFGF